MNRRRLLIGLGVAIAATAAWFLVVDFSWFEDFCPDCRHGRTVVQYRVCGVAVHEESRDWPTAIERASIDFGIPCLHSQIERWHKHRRWGLLICRCPCINGTILRDGDLTWYDQRLAAKIKALRISHPDVGAEFRQRVLVEHDREFWLSLIDEIESGKPLTDKPIDEADDTGRNDL